MDEQQQDNQPAHDAEPFAVRHTPFANPDHAWVVERMDQQYSVIADGSSTWTVNARCAHCGHRAVFMAAGVPPCRPQDAQP